MPTSAATLDAAPRVSAAEKSAFDGPRMARLKSRVTAVSDVVNQSGVACLEDVVNLEWLTDARREIEERYSMNGIHETVVENVGARHGSFAHSAVNDDRLRAFLEALAAVGHPGLGGGHDPIEDVLRIVKGPAPANKPLCFHYDRSVVTMVVPIQMPVGAPGASGELIVCPNRRPHRRRVLTNVAEKVLVQNDIFRRRVVRATLPKTATATVALQPGNAYVFWGYRSLHATLPCPPDTVRTTLILHCGVVHPGSALLARSKDVGSKLRAGHDRKTSSARYLVLQGTE